MSKSLSPDELERLKAAFLAIISHELRTPLTQIIAATSLLNDGFLGSLSEEQRHYLNMIETSALELNRLIQDLISFAQLQSTATELVRTTATLMACAQDAIAMQQLPINKRQLHLIRDLAPDLAPLSIDRAKMTNVISNLINNAVNFTPPGGRIMVRTRALDGGQAIDVADSGVGISKEKQTRIFEAFYQAEDTNTRTVGGLGIGLAHARQIVEAHQGWITVESVSGKGSMFTVWLPNEDRRQTTFE